MQPHEHYLKAERLLEAAENFQKIGFKPGEDSCVAKAQVHATLALAPAQF